MAPIVVGGVSRDGNSHWLILMLGYVLVVQASLVIRTDECLPLAQHNPVFRLDYRYLWRHRLRGWSFFRFKSSDTQDYHRIL